MTNRMARHRNHAVASPDDFRTLSDLFQSLQHGQARPSAYPEPDAFVLPASSYRLSAASNRDLGRIDPVAERDPAEGAAVGQHNSRRDPAGVVRRSIGCEDTGISWLSPARCNAPSTDSMPLSSLLSGLK